MLCSSERSGNKPSWLAAHFCFGKRRRPASSSRNNPAALAHPGVPGRGRDSGRWSRKGPGTRGRRWGSFSAPSWRCHGKGLTTGRTRASRPAPWTAPVNHCHPCHCRLRRKHTCVRSRALLSVACLYLYSGSRANPGDEYVFAACSSKRQPARWLLGRTAL